MATLAEVLTARPNGYFMVNPTDQLTVDGLLPPDDWKPWVARWFDGEHEAPSLIVDADSPQDAIMELADFLVNGVPL